MLHQRKGQHGKHQGVDALECGGEERGAAVVLQDAQGGGKDVLGGASCNDHYVETVVKGSADDAGTKVAVGSDDGDIYKGGCHCFSENRVSLTVNVSQRLVFLEELEVMGMLRDNDYWITIISRQSFHLIINSSPDTRD